MQKKQQIRKPNKFFVRTGVLLYGKRFIKKNIKLKIEGEINITEPYIMLASHSSYADVIATICLQSKTTTHYVASTTLKDKFGVLFNCVGVLEKKQFTVEPSFIKKIKYVMDKGRNVVIFPEGKMSADGTPTQFNESVAKLVKLLKVPVVTVNYKGCYLYKSKWTKYKKYGVPVVATITVLDKTDIASLTVTQLHQTIKERLYRNDYIYQRENSIEIRHKHLTDGMDSLLFVCPNCNAEHGIVAQNSSLVCTKCGFVAKMDHFGQLTGGFADVPTWYNFEKHFIQKQINDGNYTVSENCIAEVQAKNKYKKIAGTTKFYQDCNSIKIELPTGEQLQFKNSEFYNLPCDSKYLYIPTSNNMYRFVFGKTGLATKISLAVELMQNNKKIDKQC